LRLTCKFKFTPRQKKINARKEGSTAISLRKYSNPPRGCICHRRAHYSSDGAEYNMKLAEVVQELEKQWKVKTAGLFDGVRLKGPPPCF
jgi:hypothetical protein